MGFSGEERIEDLVRLLESHTSIADRVHNLLVFHSLRLDDEIALVKVVSHRIDAIHHELFAAVFLERIPVLIRQDANDYCDVQDTSSTNKQIDARSPDLDAMSILRQQFLTGWACLRAFPLQIVDLLFGTRTAFITHETWANGKVGALWTIDLERN